MFFLRVSNVVKNFNLFLFWRYLGYVPISLINGICVSFVSIHLFCHARVAPDFVHKSSWTFAVLFGSAYRRRVCIISETAIFNGIFVRIQVRQLYSYARPTGPPNKGLYCGHRVLSRESLNISGDLNAMSGDEPATDFRENPTLYFLIRWKSAALSNCTLWLTWHWCTRGTAGRMEGTRYL